MKTLSALALSTAISSTFVVGLPSNGNEGKFLIQTGPDETRWVTKEEKLALRKDNINFFDITAFVDEVTGQLADVAAPSVAFPTELQHQDAVNPLLDAISTSNLESTLTKFSSFHNRYYESNTGVESANWLFDQANALINDAGIEGATVEKVQHSFAQPSIIVHIPGQSENIVVVGAHQDSVYGDNPTGPAPGADDNGSGSMTTLESLRVLLTSEEIKTGKAANSIEFHWYAGEEAGLLGSQDIFTQYRQDSKNVVGMLNQDMTGYIQGTLDAGKPESFGVITDNVDSALTEFTKLVMDGYCDIPYVEDQCGYACSDHASATRNGFPSAMIFESAMDLSDPYIHTPDDTMEYVNIGHMQQHSRLVVGFVYELGFAAL